MRPPALELAGIRADQGRRPVLIDVDLAVAPGMCMGLIGPNGAGKTTCLDVVAGRLRPRAGEVSLDGERIPTRWSLARRARAGIGYLPQGPSVFRRLSVWENLRAVPGASAARCGAMMERIGLAEDRDRAGGRLSGGQRRRLEIGRLLLLRNLRVLLCDEPFANLDPRGIDAVSELLSAAAAADGVAVLVTDHQVGSLARVCDALALMLDGRIAVSGPTEAVLADEILAARYLGKWRPSHD